MASILLWFFIVATLVHHTSSELDWTRSCNICTCIWVSGRKTANCSNRGFNEIPKDISNVVREIDFSNNPLYTLSDREFVSANLFDIHKLKFQNCSIELVNEGAFKRLALIIELDLSRNMIHELKSNTFRDNSKLRIIILSYNKLEKLEDGLFYNMTYVQRIHVDHNEISSITEKTFYELPALTDINLGYNQLKTIDFDLKLQLPKLNSLNVEENPWVCDCRLELFHQSVMRNNLITHVTRCREPLKMRGRLWNTRESFPCSPIIIHPLPSTQITATSNNVTLICKVRGEPEPDVDWTNNGHIIEKDPRKNRQKYYSSKGKTGQFTWNNLTIINLTYKDRGDYKCIAKNPGGEDEKNVTLIIDADALSGGPLGGLGGSSGLIIGLSIGLVFLLLVILILVCLYCRKTNKRVLQSKQNDLGGSSEECINMSGHLDMKKGLITDVNPINKPPRTTVPASVVSGGTEVSDAKRNLLDNESVFDYEDESRSYDFDQPLLQKSQNPLVEADYGHTPYPPDLLSFPPQRSQISPAGSNASTLIIDSRMPPIHGPQSPLHSPIYDQLSMYKTLPYSRSQSPFAPGIGIARIPRQGYVTIPRKPRQSWSSEPPPSSEGIAEPLYDNLGIRSTVDGSSVLSLNKTGTDPVTTPRINRLLPPTPSTIDPIVESHESPNTSATQQEQQSIKVSPVQPLASPRKSHTPSVKPQVPQKPIKSQTLPRKLHSSGSLSQSSTEKRHSVTSDMASSTDEGKPKKIPPRVPPKPPKSATKSSKPLFEDEGEDGTEV
ncbi:hypothetical protein ABEB36_005668 [Hypothenemus hampei]|uniref:Ig-like domain-containing protein n=1 Tax=Hypothenemus hampei TaxID=57062 RepID=A0ABD1EZ09_HYPHA